MPAARDPSKPACNGASSGLGQSQAEQQDDPDPTFDPFRRVDRYGLMGKTPQPWTEWLRLALLTLTLVPFKALFCFLGVFMAYTCSRISYLLPAAWQDPFLEVTLKASARTVLYAVGFISIKTVKVTDPENPHVASNTQGKRKLARAQTKGRELRKPVAVGLILGNHVGWADHDALAVGAILSNHVGWADILVHMTRWLPSFVAREQTMQLPFIGITSIAMGCLFVNREKNGTAVSKEFVGVAARVKERMQQIVAGTGPRRPILLFPEGTTTNGDYLLSFRTGSFIAGVPVQPTILKYGPSRVSPAWETISGARHIWLMLTNPLHTVTVYELPVYIPSEEEQADPRLFADNVRQFMLKYSNLTSHSATFDDKRVYHAKLQGHAAPVIKKTQ